MFSSFWIGDKPQKPQNGRHVLWPFPYELISRVFALSFWLYVSTNIWQENIIPFSLHLEPNIRWRSESLPLASAPPSRHLRECDICTCPFSIWAPIHHHGLLFLFPNFVPQATKCAWFSLLHNLALWPVVGTLPFWAHLFTEDWGKLDHMIFKGSPILNIMTKLYRYI